MKRWRETQKQGTDRNVGIPKIDACIRRVFSSSCHHERYRRKKKNGKQFDSDDCLQWRHLAMRSSFVQINAIYRFRCLHNIHSSICSVPIFMIRAHGCYGRYGLLRLKLILPHIYKIKSQKNNNERKRTRKLNNPTHNTRWVFLFFIHLSATALMRAYSNRTTHISNLFILMNDN